MEVHHHSDLHHKSKKWKEYFLEFLMIFLAVTMGFFAENIREYFAEKRQEREYVQSMINDLKADTAYIAGYIKANNESVLAYSDSLIKQLDKEQWDDSTKAAIFVYSGFQGRVNYLFFLKRNTYPAKEQWRSKIDKKQGSIG